MCVAPVVPVTSLLRADTVGHLEGDDGRGVIGLQQHRQAVGIELVFVDAVQGFDVRKARDLWWRSMSGRASGEQPERKAGAQQTI